MIHRYNPDIHQRRSVRLKGHDYAAIAAYFITMCAHERKSLFGEIVDGEMFPGEYGRIVLTEWLKTSDIRQEVLLGECVVMPNHFHGILQVNDEATWHKGTARRALIKAQRARLRRAPGRAFTPATKTLLPSNRSCS